jgi:hypothetical protein
MIKRGYLIEKQKIKVCCMLNASPSVPLSPQSSWGEALLPCLIENFFKNI